MTHNIEEHLERYGGLKRELDLLKAELHEASSNQVGYKELARITTEIENVETSLESIEWHLEKIGLHPSDKHYLTNATNEELVKLAEYWEKTRKVEAVSLSEFNIEL